MTTTKIRRTIGTINSGLEVTGEISADEVGSTVVLKHICYLLKFVYINPTTYKDPVIISVLYLLGGCGLMLKFCCLDVVGGVCALDRSKYYTYHCQHYSKSLNCADIMQVLQFEY